MSAQEAGFEILEHTADVGVHSWATTCEEAFRQSTLGLLDIIGAWHPGTGERETIEVSGRDRAAVLVDWLGEVLYLQDARDVVVSDLGIDEVTEQSATGWVELAERPLEIEGTAVKAITYHQLDVSRAGDRWETTVYLDI